CGARLLPSFWPAGIQHAYGVGVSPGGVEPRRPVRWTIGRDGARAGCGCRRWLRALPEAAVGALARRESWRHCVRLMAAQPCLCGDPDQNGRAQATMAVVLSNAS